MDSLKVFEHTILSTLNTPYVYGGSNFSGWDCSGLMIYFLQSLGMFPHGKDVNSRGLHDFLMKTKNVIVGARPEFGVFAFYGKSVETINHVHMLLNNTQTIGAEGGDDTVVTVEDAVRKSAFVKVKPFGYRGIPVAMLKPQYPWGI